MRRARLPRLLSLLLAACALALAAGTVAAAHPTSTTDTDHDGAGPTATNPGGTDNCPDAFNPDQVDTDADARPMPAPGSTPMAPPTNTGGDACDTDDDGDAIDDAVDNCRVNPNREQIDIDGDGEGDLCDDDDDADGVRDARDNCIKTANPDQADRDDDFVGNACDPDFTPTPRPAPGGGSGPQPAPTPQAGPAPSPGPTPGPPAEPDRTRPSLKLGVRRSHRLDELGAGLAVGLAISEPSALEAELLLDGRAARRLKLSRSAKPMRLAAGTAAVAESGRTFVFARFSRATLRRLAKSRTATRPLLRVTARDAAGNAVTVTRRLKLRR